MLKDNTFVQFNAADTYETNKLTLHNFTCFCSLKFSNYIIVQYQF